MRRDRLRVVLAVVLIGSAALFVAGSIVEHRRNVAATALRPVSPAPATTTVTPLPQTSAPLTEALQASPTVQPVAGLPGKEGGAQHEAAEHAHPSVVAGPTSQTSLASSSPAAARPASQSSPASTAPAEGSPQREAAEKSQTLGVNVESPPLVAAGAAATLLLAVAALVWRRRAVLWLIAAFALSFGALDVREVAVQGGTGRSSVIALAGVLVVVHLAAASIAVAAAGRERQSTVPASL